MIRDVYSDPGSRYFSIPYPDPRVKMHQIPDPGSGSATLVKLNFATCANIFHVYFLQDSDDSDPLGKQTVMFTLNKVYKISQNNCF